jgi:hypothetical protein
LRFSRRDYEESRLLGCNAVLVLLCSVLQLLVTAYIVTFVVFTAVTMKNTAILHSRRSENLRSYIEHNVSITGSVSVFR